MDNQIILTALAKLEKNLQGISSAKEQVEQVTKSYSQVESQFVALQNEMAAVSKSIKDIMDAIRENQDALNGQIFDMAKSRLSAFGNGVEELEQKAKEIHDLFQSDCNKGLKSLNDSTSAAVTSFQGSLDRVNKNQETYLAKMIDDFQASINKYLDSVSKLSIDLKTTLDEFIQSQRTLHHDINESLSAFNDDISSKLTSLEKKSKSLADNIESKIKNTNESLSTFNDNISSKLTSLDEKSQSLADNIGSKIDVSSKNMSDGLSSLQSVIITKLDSMEKRQNIIYIFSLIAMIISVLSLSILLFMILK